MNRPHAAALVAIAATAAVVAAGSLVVHAQSATAATSASAPRWKPPTKTPTPTPSATPTPTPTPTPSPTVMPSPAPACGQTTTWNGASYCLVPAVNLLTDGTFPPDTRLAATGAYVAGVDGSTVTLTGPGVCPPGMYCGTTFVDAVVTFGPGTQPPVYGEGVDVYGHTTVGGFTVDGYVVTLPCEYGLGCA